MLNAVPAVAGAGGLAGEGGGRRAGHRGVLLVAGVVRLVAAGGGRGAGALTAKWVAAAADTAMLLLVPVMLLLAASVAVTVWLPAVLSVTEKVRAPLVRVLLAGRVAAPSELVKCTVPP